MAAPKGNTNALGNRGGGRKSAYQEMKDADWLREVWSSEIDVHQLTMRIKSGIHSTRDVYLFNALNGNPVILKSMADKMLPDRKEVALSEKRREEPLFTEEQYNTFIERAWKRLHGKGVEPELQEKVLENSASAVP